MEYTAVELLYEEIDSIVKLPEKKWEEVTRAFEKAKQREKKKEEQYNNMLSMLQETYRRLDHTDMISLRKQIKEVLTF